MRQSKAFGWFLDQLTWGTTEVGGSHGSSMLEYQLQKGFQEDYGPQKTTRPTYGHEQVYSSQKLDRSATSANQPQLTTGVLAKQHETIRSGHASKPYEQQQLQEKQQLTSGGGWVSGGSVPLTAGSLARLNLQNHPEGAGSWFQTSGDTRGHTSDNIWGQPSGPSGSSVTQQRPTSNLWDQPSSPQENQQQDEDDWYQPSGPSFPQQGGDDNAWQS